MSDETSAKLDEIPGAEEALLEERNDLLQRLAESEKTIQELKQNLSEVLLKELELHREIRGLRAMLEQKLKE